MGVEKYSNYERMHVLDDDVMVLMMLQMTSQMPSNPIVVE